MSSAQKFEFAKELLSAPVVSLALALKREREFELLKEKRQSFVLKIRKNVKKTTKSKGFRQRARNVLCLSAKVASV